MKKTSLIAVGLCLAAMLSAKTPDWMIIQATQAKDLESKLVCRSPEAFDLTVTAKKECKNVGLQLVRTYNYKVYKNTDKVCFKARSVSGEPIHLNLLFSIRKDNKIVTCWGPKLVVSGKEFRSYEFPVAKAFGVKDAEFQLWQFKPSTGIINGKPGKSVTLEVRDFAFGADAALKK